MYYMRHIVKVDILLHFLLLVILFIEPFDFFTLKKLFCFFKALELNFCTTVKLRIEAPTSISTNESDPASIETRLLSEVLRYSSFVDAFFSVLFLF